MTPYIPNIGGLTILGTRQTDRNKAAGVTLAVMENVY
jgi:hypothetical protein